MARTRLRLVFQFHHACCDGFGALQFIEEVMIAYARECGVSAAELPLAPLEPERLARRGVGCAKPIHFDRIARLVGRSENLDEVRLAVAGPVGRD